MAPMKGSMSRRILFGHLLGLGLRHSSNGSGFGLRGPSDTHLSANALCLDVAKVGASARLYAPVWGSSSARKARHDGRKGGIIETLAELGRERVVREDHGRQERAGRLLLIWRSVRFGSCGQRSGKSCRAHTTWCRGASGHVLIDSVGQLRRTSHHALHASCLPCAVLTV